MVVFPSPHITSQCGLICGAIEESSKSQKAIDERVSINFRDKNAVFTPFRDTNVVFTIFCDKTAVFTNFTTHMTFLKYKLLAKKLNTYTNR